MTPCCRCGRAPRSTPFWPISARLRKLRAFAERWQVARLLDAGGKSYREIAAEAHASPTTVVRVARYLKDMPHQGYRIALDRLKA